MRVLLNNLFSTILKRGIPLYTKNLDCCLKNMQMESTQIFLPKLSIHLPRFIVNFLFIFYEQFIIPILACKFDKVIYPYNSISIIGSLNKNSLLIVHDFIPNDINKTALASLYIRFTQWMHAKLGGDVAFISQSTLNQAMQRHAFPNSRIYLLPNSFYIFIEKLHKISEREIKKESDEYVLLCSGTGENKNLVGALDLANLSGMLSGNLKLKIFGLAGDDSIVNEWCEKNKVNREIIDVCTLLTDEQVAYVYLKAKFVWVHSLHEGFGRPITEALLCSQKVLATDIPPFKEQQTSNVFYYKDLKSFNHSYAVLQNHVDVSDAQYIPPEHKTLEKELSKWLEIG